MSEVDKAQEYWLFPDDMSRAERDEWLAAWKADQEAKKADAEMRARRDID